MNGQQISLDSCSQRSMFILYAVTFVRTNILATATGRWTFIIVVPSLGSCSYLLVVLLPLKLMCNEQCHSALQRQRCLWSHGSFPPFLTLRTRPWANSGNAYFWG